MWISVQTSALAVRRNRFIYSICATSAARFYQSLTVLVPELQVLSVAVVDWMIELQRLGHAAFFPQFGSFCQSTEPQYWDAWAHPCAFFRNTAIGSPNVQVSITLQAGSSIHTYLLPKPFFHTECIAFEHTWQPGSLLQGRLAKIGSRFTYLHLIRRGTA